VNSLNDIIFFHVAAIQSRPHGLFHGVRMCQLAVPLGARLVHCVAARPGVSDVWIHLAATGTATAKGTLPARAPVYSDIFIFFISVNKSETKFTAFCL